MPELKLGKKLGHVEDPRTLQLKSLLPATLPTPPNESYIGKGEPVRMYANDKYGCCTCAAQGHRIDIQERSSRQQEIQVTETDILNVYKQVEIGDDGGAYMMDVLKLMRTIGMGKEQDGSAHTIAAFAQLRLKDKELWKVACWMFGGIYLGVWLPWSARAQLRAGRWTITAGPDAEPGSWGGHAVYVSGYSDSSLVITTWDQRVRATWDWVDKYCDEAYVMISEDLLRTDASTPRGFRVGALQKYLQELS